MKNLFLSIVAIFLVSVNATAGKLTTSTNDFVKIEKSEDDKRVKVDTYMTDDNGVRWHITGWVDVSILSQSISHYDITMTSGSGSIHFSGRVSQPVPTTKPCKNCTIDGELTDTNTKAVLELNDNYRNLLFDLDAKVIAENK